MALEDGVPAVRGGHGTPRATLLLAGGTLAGIQTSVWMGGAQSRFGDEILIESMRHSCVIDTAGEMPIEFRSVTGLWVPCVFTDLDSVPPHMDRIHATVRRVADTIRAGDGAPDAVYTVCQHGMNRSGLLAGLLLCELGMSGNDAVALIVAKRPGALSNLTYRSLIGASREI
ncbi:MAG: hypothetical protein ABI305_01465 [Tepidiformaceae bacterium]